LIIQDDWDSWDPNKSIFKSELDKNEETFDGQKLLYGKLLIDYNIPQVFFDDNKNDPIVLLRNYNNNLKYNRNIEVSGSDRCKIVKPTLLSILDDDYFNNKVRELLPLHQLENPEEHINHVGGRKIKKTSKRKTSKKTSKKKGSKKTSKKKGSKKTSKRKGSKRTSKRKTSKKTSKKKGSKKR